MRTQDTKAQVSDCAQTVIQLLFDTGYNSLIQLPRRRPLEVHKTDTAGWHVCIGRLRSSGAWLEIWMDRWVSKSSQSMYAGVVSGRIANICAIHNALPPHRQSVRTVTVKDVSGSRYARLKRALRADHFGSSVLEKGLNGYNYLGFYAAGDPKYDACRIKFIEQAVEYYKDLARAQDDSEHEQDTPPGSLGAQEPSKLVVHRTHERCKKYAERAKRETGYRCKVCDESMREKYGELGHKFLEAHHTKPLHLMKPNERTDPNDIIGVCANCHRMLHRMSGDKNDWKTLRKNLLR